MTTFIIIIFNIVKITKWKYVFHTNQTLNQPLKCVVSLHFNITNSQRKAHFSALNLSQVFTPRGQWLITSVLDVLGLLSSLGIFSMTLGKIFHPYKLHKHHLQNQYNNLQSCFENKLCKNLAHNKCHNHAFISYALIIFCIKAMNKKRCRH